MFFGMGTDPCFFRFWGHRRLWHRNQNKHGSVPVCSFLTGPYPIFLLCKRPFSVHLLANSHVATCSRPLLISFCKSARLYDENVRLVSSALGEGLPNIIDGDARRNFQKQPLKVTILGVAPANFIP